MTSILAYVWLIAILAVWTPDVVTMWEAIMTLLLLPFTVFVAYSADKGDLQKRLGELDAVIDAIEEKIDDGLHVAEELVEKGEATTRKLADASGLTKLADETGLTAAVLDTSTLQALRALRTGRPCSTRWRGCRRRRSWP